MFLLRFSLLLCLMPFVAAYPMVGGEDSSRSRQVKHLNTQEAKVKQGPNTGLDPADYPDLTNRLSDAEVESTLNGLSLNDLNALNKLLDDAGNGPFDLEASLRGHHRAAKKQHYDDLMPVDEDLDAALSPGKQPLNDGCHDEDDIDKEKDLCTERPKCRRPTTRRCTSTRKCSTSCRSMDGFLDINLDTGKFNDVDFKSKSSAFEECDPEDTMCLQRNQHRSKQRLKIQDFSDMGMAARQPTNMESLEQLAAQAHRDESIKLHKQLDGWSGKDEGLPDSFNMDYGKLSHSAEGANLNDFNEMPKLCNFWSQDKVAEDEGQPQLKEEEPKQAELDGPYERHLMARVAHEQQQPEAEKAADYKQAEESDGSVLDENMQLNAAPAVGQDRSGDELEAAEPLPLVENMAANDGDSFIAKNEREPVRYLIQTDNGIIRSENEPGEHQLRSDKEHSEMLNYESFQLSNERSPSQNQLQSKRFKRDSKKTDDAPENANESYLKKLMDSFPRDQGGQSNLNMAIRQANRAHLRIKRS